MLPALPTLLALRAVTPHRSSAGPGRRKVAWLATAVLALLSSPSQAAKTPPKGFAPSIPVVTAPRIADGSIFNVNAGYAPLIEGNRARAVGDIVNIVLAEATTTNKPAVTKTQRASTVAMPAPAIGPLNLNALSLNGSSNSSFNGQGNTTQTNALNGSVTVTIAEVRPNGTVLVRGEKQMLFSQGTEWIQFSGIVRIADINADTDSVLSTQVANAHMEYSGNGSIQRSAREGWLSKFFNTISPF